MYMGDYLKRKNCKSLNFNKIIIIMINNTLKRI